MTLRDKLAHAVTGYDRQQMGKRGYNVWALEIYLTRVEDVAADIDAGADVRAAIVAGFSGRLLDRCLKATGLPKSTDAEQRGGVWHYAPVTGVTR